MSRSTQIHIRGSVTGTKGRHHIQTYLCCLGPVLLVKNQFKASQNWALAQNQHWAVILLDTKKKMYFLQ